MSHCRYCNGNIDLDSDDLCERHMNDGAVSRLKTIQKVQIMQVSMLLCILCVPVVLYHHSIINVSLTLISVIPILVSLVLSMKTLAESL